MNQNVVRLCLTESPIAAANSALALLYAARTRMIRASGGQTHGHWPVAQWHIPEIDAHSLSEIGNGIGKRVLGLANI